jgi:hypothetical protein
MHTITYAWLALIFWLFVGISCAYGDTLEKINREVNWEMSYKADMYDNWDATCPAQGDCEDYALCKARKLILAGYPPQSISIVATQSPQGYHAVLVVDGMVLDNQTNVVYHESEIKHLKPIFACRLDGMLGNFLPVATKNHETILGQNVYWIPNKEMKCSIAMKTLDNL